MAELRNPLEKFLKQESMTLSELSDELMVSYTTVHSWKKGKTIPSHGNMKKLSRMMDVSSGVLRLKWTRWMDTQNDKEGEEDVK